MKERRFRVVGRGDEAAEQYYDFFDPDHEDFWREEKDHSLVA
jgi:hypothetical protein